MIVTDSAVPRSKTVQADAALLELDDAGALWVVAGEVEDEVVWEAPCDGCVEPPHPVTSINEARNAGNAAATEPRPTMPGSYDSISALTNVASN